MLAQMSNTNVATSPTEPGAQRLDPNYRSTETPEYQWHGGITGKGKDPRGSIPTGPYEAPEKGDPYGSNGPPLIQKLPNGGGVIPPPVVNPGGQTMPSQAKAYGLTEGYDQGKMNDANYHSPKYDLGRLTADIGVQRLMTPEGQAELQQKLLANPYFKGARVVGDKIMYTGQHGQPVTIDYMMSSHGSDPHLGYLTSDHGGAARPPAGKTGPFIDPTGNTGINGGNVAQPNPGMNSDFFRQLMERLNGPGAQHTMDELDPAQRAAILKLLQEQEDPNQIHAMGAPV